MTGIPIKHRQPYGAGGITRDGTPRNDLIETEPFQLRPIRPAIIEFHTLSAVCQ